MVVYKAFKTNELNVGNTYYELGRRISTNKPCVLRTSGIHACTSVAAAKKYYPDAPVIVAGEMADADVRDQYDGIVVGTAITLREYIDPSQAPAEEDDEDEWEDSSETDSARIANKLRELASEIEDNF